MTAIVYGMIDAEGVLLNPVVAEKNDTTTLERIKSETESAVDYAPLDDEVYLIRVGMLKWNGTYWEKAL
jgi:hypothetical protein